nr:alpha/beta hydrolase-fold protein [Skermania sp. ID1734]
MPQPAPITNVQQHFSGGYGHGVSLLGGWFPLVIEIAAVVVLLVVVLRRSRRWWLVWVPVSILVSVAAAFAAHWYMDSEDLASDPAPWQLWVWTGVAAAAIAVAVVGWRRARWWRRGVSVLAIPLSVLAVSLVLNQWVGYYPTLTAAWSALTAGPLPDQVDADALPALRDTNPSTGKVVPVDIPDTASGFNHRTEYVYLPPAWFNGKTPPQLPVLMMIAGEFNTPADWMRSGNIIPFVDSYAQHHHGQTPILVFVDAGGSFNNDTECVDGPRGNVASHLTKDVRPYVISTFGASSDPAHWGIVGWSMGGTCAVDLTVMHPDLFHTFEDIAGDAGPVAGTKQQTIDRLFGGSAAAWNAYDPATVMAAHGPYTGVSGLFEDLVPPARPANWPGNAHGGNHNWHPPQVSDQQVGLGGRDMFRDTGETGAAEKLCADAQKVDIGCVVATSSGGHTWQFAEKAFEVGLPWLITEMSGQPSAS